MVMLSTVTSPPMAAPLSLALVAASACPPNAHPSSYKAIHGLSVVVDKDSSKVFRPKPKANADFTHFHISMISCLVVFYHAMTAADAGKNQINIGVAEKRIPRSTGNLASDVRSYLVEVGQGFILHFEDRLAFLGFAVSTGCCSTAHAQCQNDTE